RSARGQAISPRMIALFQRTLFLDALRACPQDPLALLLLGLALANDRVAQIALAHRRLFMRRIAVGLANALREAEAFATPAAHGDAIEPREPFRIEHHAVVPTAVGTAEANALIRH